MGLITLIPGIGILIALLILAFNKWPIETEMEQRRGSYGVMPPNPVTPGYPPQG